MAEDERRLGLIGTGRMPGRTVSAAVFSRCKVDRSHDPVSMNTKAFPGSAIGRGRVSPRAENKLFSISCFLSSEGAAVNYADAPRITLSKNCPY